MIPSQSERLIACPACGDAVASEARYCPHCGAAISEIIDLSGSRKDLVVGGRYRIGERLSSDSFGVCFEASTEKGEGPYDVSFAHQHFARSVSFRKNLEIASQKVRGLSHPGIVPIVDSGVVMTRAGAVPFLVTDHFDGRAIGEIMRTRGLLPTDKLICFAVQVLSALAAIHEHGFVHGDLKPENIVLGAGLDAELLARITGTAVARVASRALPRICTEGSLLGTPVYAAPESHDDACLGPAADIYSLGAILYEQVTGRLPFESPSAGETARQHAQSLPIRPSLRNTSRPIGAALDACIMRALSKTPSDRYSSAIEMGRQLLVALDEAESLLATLDKSAPIDALRALSGPRAAARAGTRSAQRAVGREQTVENLKSVALSPVERIGGTGKVVVLLGEAGMGKSAIIDDLCDKLVDGPMAVLRIDGRKSVSLELEPFTEALREWCGLQRGASEQQCNLVSAWLRARVGINDEDVDRLVDRMSARECALPLTLSLREREETSAIRSVMGRVVGACPTVLIVEDADAMDRPSARLTLDIMEVAARRPLSVIVTARAEPWPDWKASHASRQLLPPLDTVQSHAWLRTRMADVELPADALEAMVAWAKGAPTLLELAAQRLLLRTSSSMRELASALQTLENEADDELQSTVDLIMRTSPRPVRQWIECASVVGMRVPVELISACVPVTSAREDMLRACAATSLLGVRDDQLVFRGEGIRSVVRSLVARDDRDQYHRFVAAWFGEAEPQRACPEIVAQHFEACGATVEAADQYERGARDLLSRGLARAAASVFARASELWQRVGDNTAAHRTALDRVESLLRAGDGKAAAEELLRLETDQHPAEGLRARAIALTAQSEGNTELACKALLRASEAAVDALDQLSWFYVEC